MPKLDLEILLSWYLMQKVNNTNLCPTGIYLYVEDCDATYNRVLQEGATSLVEPANQFYGDRSSGVKNQFANQWWIATRKEDLSPEEYTKRKGKQEQNQH
jgi:PhnB protein